ncbi:hypothetical protein PIB30_089401 [Stylosanthes scabra]|uniref:Uncharacterized protein n=1 Tax=Stylosanthes scabra TaxID=79078 RepID=A0ABU6RUF8_9FABA|nr:hypothetical protein [Stylosanthes scabra]
MKIGLPDGIDVRVQFEIGEARVHVQSETVGGADSIEHHGGIRLESNKKIIGNLATYESIVLDVANAKRSQELRRSGRKEMIRSLVGHSFVASFLRNRASGRSVTLPPLGSLRDKLARYLSSPSSSTCILLIVGLFIYEMTKKKSCQNIHNPRVLSPVERELYSWVDAEVFTQSSVFTSEHLPELLREMRLAQDPASKGDFVLEAVEPSDRLPFQAIEDMTHFLWVYDELFTCLGVRSFFGFSKGSLDVVSSGG